MIECVICGGLGWFHGYLCRACEGKGRLVERTPDGYLEESPWELWLDLGGEGGAA